MQINGEKVDSFSSLSVFVYNAEMFFPQSAMATWRFVMHLWPGIGGGFELRSVFLFKCLAPGKSFWAKKVQIPHSRSIIAGQKNSTNDQKSLPRRWELLLVKASKFRVSSFQESCQGSTLEICEFRRAGVESAGWTMALGTRRRTKKKQQQLVWINLLRLVVHSGNCRESFLAKWRQ